ncbi:hypothetical protein [Spirosoma aerolatum]|uniref:hypothetical protein n=1 Tax=Spirosoma aerolatum TaxID=1211326 RepID=UPI0009ACED10|nr:hypothetical protein [Spirosoma aerolatum]
MDQQTQELKRQIERILHWEPSSHWRLRDFVHLRDLVFSQTNQELNVDDLQAFWQVSEIPSIAFLDTLTHFIEYEGWGDFCHRNQVSEMVPVRPDAFHARSWEIPTRWIIIICWLSAIASIVVSILLIRHR